MLGFASICCLGFIVIGAQHGHTVGWNRHWVFPHCLPVENLYLYEMCCSHFLLCHILPFACTVSSHCSTLDFPPKWWAYRFYTSWRCPWMVLKHQSPTFMVWRPIQGGSRGEAAHCSGKSSCAHAHWLAAQASWAAHVHASQPAGSGPWPGGWDLCVKVRRETLLQQ